jgi:hypothetical protein
MVVKQNFFNLNWWTKSSWTYHLSLFWSSEIQSTNPTHSCKSNLTKKSFQNNFCGTSQPPRWKELGLLIFGTSSYFSKSSYFTHGSQTHQLFTHITEIELTNKNTCSFWNSSLCSFGILKNAISTNLHFYYQQSNGNIDDCYF